MLEFIMRFSVRNKLIIGVLVLFLVVFGINSLRHLPIDAVPDITNNQVQLITRAPELAAQDIERLVTFPLEQAIATIPELVELRSFSRFGLSVITIVFEEHTDLYRARQLVFERLNQVPLPPGMQMPEMAPISTGLGEIYQYHLMVKPGYEKQYDATELRTIQDWFVRRSLLGTPGLADVSSFGGFVKEYEIAINPTLLETHQIRIDEILNILNESNANSGSAYIEKDGQAWFIRSEGLIKTLDEIGRIPIKSLGNGKNLRIQDIAELKFGHSPRYGALTQDSLGESVGGIVMMLKGENSYEVVNRVKEKISSIEKSLPEGVYIQSYLDRSELIDRAIKTVRNNLIEGALIVIFVLILFLGNLRAGLIVAMVIPLSLLFAISMMNLFGISGNLMSLGAIDFGLVIDGSLIIVEATLHHLSKLPAGKVLTRRDMDEEVLTSGARIRNAAAFGEFIILIVYLPILSLQGVEGKMFQPMAQTVAFAIVGAFLLSLTFVPAASAYFLKTSGYSSTSMAERFMDFLKSKYKPLLYGTLRKTGMVLIAAILLFLGAFWQFNRMGSEFLPQLDEGDFAIEMRGMPGMGLQANIDANCKAAAILLREFPDEVVEVVGKIGTSEIPTDPMPLEASDVMVILKPKKEWKKADNREDLANLMQEALEVIPGVNFGFQQPIQMRFNELMTGVKQDVAVKIFGEDLDMLDTLGVQIEKLVNSIEGATDLYRESIGGRSQLMIRPNREKMALHNVRLIDINQSIQAANAGLNAGIIFEGEKQFNLVVRMDSAFREDPNHIRTLRITNTLGQRIPLEQVADIQMEETPIQIQRENTKRRLLVGFNIRGRDVSGVVTELQALCEQHLQLPSGYTLEFGGQFENLQQANARLLIAVPAALLVILLLLYLTFHSVVDALIIFSAIPLASIGAIAALWLRDMPFSISAGIGFIALFGVAVLNGIVLLSEFQRQRKTNGLLRSVLLGSCERLRPVLMTATVASLGFLPMALATSAGAEVQKPLATVVIGGLISSTFLTLFVLPALYILIHKLKKS